MDGLNVTITVEDNSPEVLEAYDQAEERALYLCGVKIQEGATRSISGQYTESMRAVDTGRLRASISFITPKQASGMSPDYKKSPPPNASANDLLTGRADGHSVVFGTNVEYAVYVHEGLGTNKGKGARPFLREGLDRKLPEIQRDVQRVFKGEI